MTCLYIDEVEVFVLLLMCVSVLHETDPSTIAAFVREPLER